MLDLYIDAGNTRIKAWVCDGNEVRSRYSIPHHNDFQTAITTLFVDIKESVSLLGAIYCVSVLGASGDQVINDCSLRLFGLKPRFATVLDSAHLGIQCGYEQPERLGIDRWLGVVAVADGERDYCVVDSGTALTIDIVTKDSQHLGGYIIPGLRLMTQSLLANTKQVRVDSQECFEAGLGKNTNQAVYNGALISAVGAVELAVNRFEQSYQRKIALILTGGTAEQLSSILNKEHQLEPELLLQGLQRYFAKVGIKQ